MDLDRVLDVVSKVWQQDTSVVQHLGGICRGVGQDTREILIIEMVTTDLWNLPSRHRIREAIALLGRFEAQAHRPLKA